MFGLGTQELILILLIVVVMFGATRLPQIGSGIGQVDEIEVTPKQESSKTSTKEKIEKEESD
jgi:sec-independent protein translocase protein TatA